MPILDNLSQIIEIEKGLKSIQLEKDKPLIQDPFTKDFSFRFCWSSNAIDLYQAISQLLIPFRKKEITAEWIKQANGLILGTKSYYRKR